MGPLACSKSCHVGRFYAPVIGYPSGDPVFAAPVQVQSNPDRRCSSLLRWSHPCLPPFGRKQSSIDVVVWNLVALAVLRFRSTGVDCARPSEASTPYLPAFSVRSGAGGEPLEIALTKQRVARSSTGCAGPAWPGRGASPGGGGPRWHSHRPAPRRGDGGEALVGRRRIGQAKARGRSKGEGASSAAAIMPGPARPKAARSRPGPRSGPATDTGAE